MMVELAKNDCWHVISFEDFFSKKYKEEDSCVVGNEDYTWLDVTLLILFAIWVGEKV